MLQGEGNSLSLGRFKVAAAAEKFLSQFELLALFLRIFFLTSLSNSLVHDKVTIFVLFYD